MEVISGTSRLSIAISEQPRRATFLARYFAFAFWTVTGALATTFAFCRFDFLVVVGFGFGLNANRPGTVVVGRAVV
jgi:hypothetical protein